MSKPPVKTLGLTDRHKTIKRSFVQKTPIHFGNYVIIRIEILLVYVYVLHTTVLFYTVFHRIKKCQLINECGECLRYGTVHFVYKCTYNRFV